MGFINVFKGIGRGFAAVGKGVARGVDATAGALNHPAATPALAAVSVFLPVAWLEYGIQVVRTVKATADSVRDVPVSDEEKRRLFAQKFREQFPDASDGDLATLACVLTKLEKSEDTNS